MPTFEYICEVCGKPSRAWRSADSPPRFCDKNCKNKGLFGKGPKPIKWPITPEMAEEIKRLYQTDTGNGQVAALAKKWGYPRWKISRYVVIHGWVPTQPKEPDWSDEEKSILERNAHFSPEAIRRRLKNHGYVRSVSGIVNKRKRLRYCQNLNGQSAVKLALCFGTDAKFVTKAIQDGRLKAARRGTRRTERQGGDSYYIKDKDIRKYIIDNVHEIDFRKADKYWLIDILAGNI